MIEKLCFYVSDTTDPYWNLATERALLDAVDQKTLLLYLWQNQSTVVIGRNQNAFSECRTELLRKEGGHLARRPSGGGAVFHDLGNLNFSFLSSAENLDDSLYRAVIRAACVYAGIYTEISGRNDILVNGKKCSGCASYLSHGKGCYHGTLLVNADMQKLERYLTPPRAKMETKGIQSVRSRVINLSTLCPTLSCDEMRRHLLAAAEAAFGLSPIALPPPPHEAVAPHAAHFSDPRYLYGSPIPFNVSCEGQLPFGHAELRLSVVSGRITDLALYTDALDPTLPATVREALVSLPFELPAISAALSGAIGEAEGGALTSLLTEQIFA